MTNYFDADMYMEAYGGAYVWRLQSLTECHSPLQTIIKLTGRINNTIPFLVTVGRRISLPLLLSMQESRGEYYVNRFLHVPQWLNDYIYTDTCFVCVREASINVQPELIMFDVAGKNVLSSADTALKASAT